MSKERRLRIGIAIIIIIQCCLWIFCGFRKEGYNYDELMIYHYASKLFADYETRVDFQYQNNFYNMIHTSEEFMDTLSVHEGEGFWEQPAPVKVRAILKEDTYTVFLNMLMSAFDGQFSKWYCIVLNIGLFIIAQLCLYKLCCQISGSRRCAVLTILFYGFSIAAGKPVMFLRFYEFFIVAALLYAVLGISALRQNQVNWKFFLKILLSMILTLYGYYNAEYMIVFAFSFSVAFVLICLFKKWWKKAGAYCLCYGIGAIAFLFKMWDKFMVQFQAEESQLFFALNQLVGGEFIEFVKYVVKYTAELLFDTGLGILAIVFLAGIIINRFSGRKIVQGINIYWITILLTAAVYILIIAKIAPWIAWRYGTVMGPFFVLLACVAVWGVVREMKRETVVIGLVVCAQLLYFGLFQEIGGVTTGEVKDAVHAQVNEQFADYDGIMFTTGDRGDLYFGSFMWPKNGRMYVTSTEMITEDTKDKKEILENNELLVWARSGEKWEEEIEPIMNSLGYLNNEMVIDTGEARFLIYLCKR